MDQNQTEQMSRRELKKQYLEQKKQGQSSGKIGKYLVTLLVVAVVGVGVWLLSQGGGTDSANSPELAVINSEDHIKGPENAAVTLLEYGDFECPACATFYPVVEQIMAQYPNDVNFAFRHLPLTQIHNFAFPSAMAAEAAARQGKFWEYYDLLYSRQTQWVQSNDKTQTFVDYAVEIGLDEEQFRNDLDNNQSEDKIRADVQTAVKFRLQSTPSFFVNGELIQTPRSFEEFVGVIENALNNSQGTENLSE